MIFDTHGCADGHGTHEVGSAALAAALVGSGSDFAPALLYQRGSFDLTRLQVRGREYLWRSHEILSFLIMWTSSVSRHLRWDLDLAR
jgi:hypothetical protein